MQTIIEELKSFNSAVEFQKGHTHLYGWFDRIVDRLENTELSDLEKEAVCATRQILLYEIDCFGCSSLMRLWIARCFVCAFELLPFIPDEDKEFYYADSRIVFCRLIKLCKVDELIPLKIRAYYCEDFMELGDFETVALLIYDFFKYSDAGRRPRDMSEERYFYDSFMNGYKYYGLYLSKTHDYSKCKEWFDVLNPAHLKALWEMGFANNQCSSKLQLMIGEVFVLQLLMLYDWEKEFPFACNLWKSKNQSKIISEL